jgi:hypothetical protein
LQQNVPWSARCGEQSKSAPPALLVRPVGPIRRPADKLQT